MITQVLIVVFVDSGLVWWYKLNCELFRECLGEAHEPASCENWKNWHQKITDIRPEERMNLLHTCIHSWLHKVHSLILRLPVLKFCHQTHCTTINWYNKYFMLVEWTEITECLIDLLLCFQCGYNVNQCCCCLVHGTEEETENSANCLWLVTNSKPCPNCKSPIQKNEGCNHMKCSKVYYCQFCCLVSDSQHNKYR